MDETKTSNDIEIKLKTFLDEDELDTDTTKLATLKIQNYSPAAKDATFEQYKALLNLWLFDTKTPNTESPAFYYLASDGQYSFSKGTGNQNGVNIESITLIDTTDTTLTDIGWND